LTQVHVPRLYVTATMDEHVSVNEHVFRLNAEVNGPATEAFTVMSSTGAVHVVLKWKYILPLKPNVGPDTVAVQVVAVVSDSDDACTFFDVVTVFEFSVVVVAVSEFVSLFC